MRKAASYRAAWRIAARAAMRAISDKRTFNWRIAWAAVQAAAMFAKAKQTEERK